ncbi:MAG: enoyl-CoA hydratase/isomerase family protein [Myxococcota bacterium]|nr:enoyl-CoA hydratase/isomerase family protein [Myxococcota bacterium]
MCRAEHRDGVAVFTFNRPEIRNALSDTLSPALRRIIGALKDDPRARAVLITGTGDSFCVGGAVKGMGSGAARPDPPPTAEEIIADPTERQLAYRR